MTTTHLLAYLYSLAIGLLIGIERERSNRGDPQQALGIRTFALIAVVGTMSVAISTGAVVVVMAAIGGLLVVGYRRTNQVDPGTTTEVAAIATFLLGALCYRDAALAAALAIVITILLVSKLRLHSFARDVLTQGEIEDGLKFLVIAFVVLPLLPNRALGPYGVLNPSHIWLIVVALTGISWVGYIAVRALGPRRGLIATGLAGGFVSATTTTVSMGRLSRSPRIFTSAVAGAQASSVATFIQLEAIMVVVSPALALRLVVPNAFAATVLLLVAIRGLRRRSKNPSNDEISEPGGDQEQPRDRAFTLLPALVLSVILTGALLVGRWGAAVFGAKGAIIATGAAGLADAHGGALSAATLFAQGNLGLDSTLLAISAALVTNSIVKCVLAFTTGGTRFGRRFLGGIGPSLATFLIALSVVALVD